MYMLYNNFQHDFVSILLLEKTKALQSNDYKAFSVVQSGGRSNLYKGDFDHVMRVIKSGVLCSPQ